MLTYGAALFIGIVSGLRTMTAPAAVSWAAYLGWLKLQDTGLAFLGYRYTPYVLTVLALVELLTDKLPQTPSRKVPMQFGARLFSGALCGAAIGMATSGWIGGLLAGAIGAVLGTLGGAEVRGWLARAFGRDLPAALVEDFVAVAGAATIMAAL